MNPNLSRSIALWIPLTHLKVKDDYKHLLHKQLQWRTHVTWVYIFNNRFSKPQQYVSSINILIFCIKSLFCSFDLYMWIYTNKRRDSARHWLMTPCISTPDPVSPSNELHRGTNELHRGTNEWMKPHNRSHWYLGPRSQVCPFIHRPKRSFPKFLDHFQVRNLQGNIKTSFRSKRTFYHREGNNKM